MRLRISVAVLGSALIVAAGGSPLCGQTVNEAKAFFKEFDDATLHGVGPVTKEVYGGGDTAAEVKKRREKVALDIFDGFSDAAQKAQAVQIIGAHGRGDLIKAEDRKKIDDAFTTAKNNGTLQRLSDLQLRIIKKHFTKDGGIDFDKYQKAVEMFSNGELRPNNQMDQLGQWVIWKKFAEVAIAKDVNKADWEKLLKSAQTGLEIQRIVYPSPAHVRDNDFSGELVGSTSARYDDTKKRTDEQKKTLRDAIAALDTAGVLARQKNLVKDMTPAALAANVLPRNMDIQLAQFVPQFGGFNVTLAIDVTDDMGAAAPLDLLTLRMYGGGLTFTPESFYLEMAAANIGDGAYEASFHWPALSVDGIGFVAVIHDTTANAFESFAVIPEPGAAALFVVGCAAVGRRRRR